MVRDRRSTAAVTLAGAALIGLALTGCGNDSPTAASTGTGVVGQASAPAANTPAATTSTPVGPHNQSDITFASAMIPRSIQVLSSTQIADKQAGTPAVKALAGSLSKAQVPRIEAMSAWLASWGQPVPAGPGTPKEGAGITQADLIKLSKTAPGQFDKLWLTTMIKHEQQAVALAQTEVKGGSSAEAKAFAQKVVTEGTAQITQMQALLKKA